MRENFTEKTKRILAGRVNYKCSYPGCSNPTIGPSGISDETVSILGEAAHIYAASPHGPRANSKMSPEELRSIKNGIWMCRHHAKLIDDAPGSYAAETLKLWKSSAETIALNAVKNINKQTDTATTLVSITDNIVFEGFWTEVKDNNTWTFSITHFLYGNIKALREISIENVTAADTNYYLCVESQGDGRMIKNTINWNFDTNTGFYTITVVVENKVGKLFLNDLGSDIKLNENLDIDFSDGDFTVVSGPELAKQTIELVLSLDNLFIDPFPLSFSSKYFYDHKEDKELLSRLIKLDLARLINIPISNSISAPLNFINRIIDVEILSTEVIESKMLINLSLEWKDGNYWRDKVNLHIG